MTTKLAQQVQENRKKGLANISAFGEAVDRIRADRTLSDEGKTLKMTHEFIPARWYGNDLAAYETSLIETRRAELERSLFGWGSRAEDGATLAARRTSTELADGFHDERDAFDAYQSAKLRSDALHAQAIFARALEWGWSRITSDYLAEHPGKAADAAELAEIRQVLAAPFGNAWYYAVAKPNELANVNVDAHDERIQAEAKAHNEAWEAQFRALAAGATADPFAI